MELFTMSVLAQDDLDAGGAVAGVFAMLLNCAILVLLIACLAGMWKTFTKAGKPGWAAIIPFYNNIIWLEIAGRPLWWILLLLIPCVNLVVGVIVLIEVARSFGKGPVIGVLALFGVGWLILGFGDATYRGPVAAPPEAA